MNSDQTLNLSAYLALLSAQNQAVLALVKTGFQELGLENISGVSFDQWMHDQTNREMDKALLGMENLNPGAAAALQQHFDETIRKLRGGSSSS